MDTIQTCIKDTIIEAIKELKISRAELARRLKVSRAVVTQMFDEGWTLDRFQKVAEALGADISINLTLPSENS